MSAIIIYQTKDKKSEIEVTVDQDTLWLNQKQISEIFGTQIPAVNKHIGNILNDGELNYHSTVSKMEIVRKEGKREVKRVIEHYNLDMVISVGYRINSRKATQFRIWATQRLKDYLIKGVAINQKRLEQLQQTIQLISKGVKVDELNSKEAQGLLEIIGNYTSSFALLNRFDSDGLEGVKVNKKITYEIRYEEAVKAISELKKQLVKRNEATSLFGNEKDEGFKSSLRSVVQTFGGKYLYPSIEEQAAHLLYFVIKNHSFSDGNKRIGAFLFIWFLEKNRHRFKKNGEVKINDNGLTALALLVAQSDPKEKDLMIKLIVNLISDQPL